VNSGNIASLPTLVTTLLLASISAGAWITYSHGFSADDELAEQHKKHPIGYRDTPQLPGSKYKVHDIDRPRPLVVSPAKSFSHQAAAPADAVMLFDGNDTSEFNGGPWKLSDGAMEVNGSGNIRSKRQFGDCQLHLEWRAPNPPQQHSQHRGNSGIYFMGHYEVQILDSHQNPTYADGQAGALYGQCPPLVNAAKEPGEWQTYDLIFRAPRFDGNKMTAPASVTLIHNGVVVHHAREFIGRTAHRSVAKYAPHGERGPIVIQDHRDNQPVQFRNIWVREIGTYP